MGDLPLSIYYITYPAIEPHRVGTHRITYTPNHGTEIMKNQRLKFNDLSAVADSEAYGSIRGKGDSGYGAN